VRRRRLAGVRRGPADDARADGAGGHEPARRAVDAHVDDRDVDHEHNDDLDHSHVERKHRWRRHPDDDPDHRRHHDAQLDVD
jgi:hypothetical protein